MTEKKFKQIKRLNAVADACGKTSVTGMVITLGTLFLGGGLKLIADFMKSRN